MRVLIVAGACYPGGGSETAFGWSAVSALAQEHDVWVITHGNQRKHYEKHQALIPPRLRVVFHGEPFEWHANRMRARIQDWSIYRNWLRDLLPLARGLHREHGFDVCQHITISTWRLPSPLVQLGIPFIWGPIGGGEKFPLQLSSILSASSFLFEAARLASTAKSLYSREIRECVRRANHIFASNGDTARLLGGIGGSADRMEILSPAFFSQEEMQKFNTGQAKPDPRFSLKLFAGGSLEGRKGISLAIRALRKVADAGIPFEYFIAGDGPELSHLKELTRKLDLTREVIFSKGLQGSSYLEKLGETHVYLLPSLRDSAGITLMEAMLCRCVPIVLACGGPAEIVSKTAGVSIEPKGEKFVIGQIAASIVELFQHADQITILGEAARKRIEESFSRENYLSRVNLCYERLVEVRTTS